MTILPNQLDKVDVGITDKLPKDTDSKWCLRCWSEKGKKVKSYTGRSGICGNHMEITPKSKIGFKVCRKCKTFFKQVGKEDRCNDCVVPSAKKRS